MSEFTERITAERERAGAEKKKVGRPRKNPVIVNGIVQEDPHALEVPDDTTVTMGGPVLRPTLANPMADPFRDYKTEQEKYHYRALNERAHNMRVRIAEGYSVVPEAPKFGDLVLARMPKSVNESKKKALAQKNVSQRSAAKNSFVSEAERVGVKTFDEK